jgi:hypothetical protein
LPTATANLCLGGVKCAQLVAFSRTREVEVHDAPLHRRAARPDRHEVARRRHAATTYRSTPHALRARGWPVCESISPQSCHACPSPSHRSVKRAPHHRPPLSPATQALPKRFAHALGPLRALYRSPASAGRTPRPLGQHPSLGRHHRQPRLSNGVSAAALRAHFRSLTYSVPSRRPLRYSCTVDHWPALAVHMLHAWIYSTRPGTVPMMILTHDSRHRDKCWRALAS